MTKEATTNLLRDVARLARMLQKTKRKNAARRKQLYALIVKARATPGVKLEDIAQATGWTPQFIHQITVTPR